MERVEATRVTPLAPADLWALEWRRRPRSAEAVRICAVGDLGLSGRARVTAERDGADRLFAEVRAVLADADVTFGNLESPLVGASAPGQQFAAPPSGASTLRDAGFDLIHLANNHVGDYGHAGLETTIRAVESAGLRPLGAGCGPEAARTMVRTDVGGVRIGWLGCGRTLLPQTGATRYWEFDAEELRREVERACRDVDVLIVSIHIGLMYVRYPRPEHKAIADRLMNAGADVIVMHHAHVLQGIQTHQERGICCFNLGNFLYDWEEGDVKVDVALDEQNESGVFLFEVDRQGVSALQVLPTWIDNDCCVRWAVGARGLKILERLERISKDLKGDFTEAFERQRAARNTGGMVRVLAYHARHGDWRYLGESLRRARWEHVKMLTRWVTGRVRTEG